MPATPGPRRGSTPTDCAFHNPFVAAAILDQATAARSSAEFTAEIDTLKALEDLALAVRRGGADAKWRELAGLLGEIFTAGGLAGRTAEPEVPYGAGALPGPGASPRQKLVIFTEHRDTLSYLQERIASLPGRRESLVVIHGSMGRADRLKVQEAFRHDPEVQVLLATDVAGEVIGKSADIPANAAAVRCAALAFDPLGFQIAQASR